jgi:hypothetical protein
MNVKWEDVNSWISTGFFQQNNSHGCIKADSHIACRAAKGLKYVFPIWFT